MAVLFKKNEFVALIKELRFWEWRREGWMDFAQSVLYFDEGIQMCFDLLYLPSDK